MKLYRTNIFTGIGKQTNILITFEGYLTAKKKEAIANQFLNMAQDREILEKTITQADALAFLQRKIFIWQAGTNASVEFHPPIINYKTDNSSGSLETNNTIFIQG